MPIYDHIVEQWQAWNICSVSELELRLDSFRILFAYHSGRIENEEITYHDTREIFENGKVVGFTGSPRTLFELQNQKVCYDFLKEKIIQKEPLSISLILEIHRTLTEGTYDERRYLVNEERPGEFKKHDYVTGENEVGSSPEEVEADLLELLEEVNRIGKQSPLTAGAYFHARFENIHPFADGNGRVGRLWHTLLLSTWNPAFAWLPVESMIYAHQQEYYAAINASNEAGESTVFIEFMLSTIQASLIDAIRTRDEMSDGKTDKAAVRREQIKRFLESHPFIMNADVRTLCNVSAATANRILAELVKEETLVKYREGGHWAYQLNM